MPFLIVTHWCPASMLYAPDVDAGPLFSPWISMTREQADDFLKAYRAKLKAWTLSIGGFSNQDSDHLYRQLEEDQDELANIALAFPEKSYSVDMLINSRRRTWAGWAAERLPRPANRLTR